MSKLSNIFLFLYISLQSIYASPIDSLKSELKGVNTEQRIDLYIEISKLYERDKPDSAIKYAILADNLSCVNNIQDEDLLHLLADIYIKRHEFEKATSYLQDILEMAISVNDSLAIVKVKNQIGSLYFSLGKYNRALSKYMDALKMSAQIGNKRTEAATQIYIGNVFYQLKSYDEALIYYEKSLNIFEEVKDSISISYIYNNLGKVYEKQGEFTQSMEFYLKSLKIKQKNKFVSGIAISYNNIAELYELQYDYEKAIDFYMKALQILEQEKDNEGIIETSVNLARTYREISKLDEAKALLYKVLILINTETSYPILIKVNDELSKVYESEGDYKKALGFYKKFTAIKDSIVNERDNLAIHEMRISLDNQNKEEQIKRLEEEKRVEQKALAKQKMMNIYIFIAFAIALISSFLLYRQYKLRQKANVRLLDKNNALKSAEKLLIGAKEKAERADLSKSVFLANMSHDIRSPMNAIIGFSDIVAQSLQADHQAIEYLGYVKQSGNSLLSLIDDIIDIAKIEAGQLKLRKQAFGLNVLMNELFVSFQTIINQKPNNKVEIKLNVPDNSENIGINSDEMRLKQVLTNFLSNAIKFTDEGVIELGYQFLPDDELLFYVKDSGVGISKDQQKLIFQRFGQVEDTYTRNYSGTGLGLAISQSIINLLSGDIWVDSEPGKGANFYFKIPAEIIESQVSESPNANLQFKHYDWQDKQILLVEDDVMSLKLLKSVLNDTSIKIVTAKDGHEVIRLIEENKIDLVLMDIQLPELNGFEATKQIKKTYNNIPVIAVSAYAMQGEIDKAKTVGCDLFISKPFNINHLLSSINDYLS